MDINGTISVSELIRVEKEKIIVEKFATHPFSLTITRGNLENALGEYFAMSQAFPYLQAGSQKNLIFHYITRNEGVPQDVEITSVIGNFLTWDETGGFQAVIDKRHAGLADILKTELNFHSNMLKRDIEMLTGKPATPNFGPITAKYLMSLYEGLASLNPIERIACMIAFENHAERMITALWLTLAKIYKVDKNSLPYFFVHVGGENPAEQYHVQMTNQMIDYLVDRNSIDAFLKAFERHYGLNFYWCHDIFVKM